MSSRNIFASIVTTCLLAVGAAGLTPAANAAPAGQSLSTLRDSASNHVIKVRRHGHYGGYRHRGHYRRGFGAHIFLPIGPSYRYYDYPYYYERGYYPYGIGGYSYYYPRRDYYSAYDYRREYARAGYARAPHSAKERCARRFRSFEWDTGYYTTYGGRKRVCPYLR